MQAYYLGADIGGTKTQALVADEHGTILGSGNSGPGNHESVGYEGQFQELSAACSKALSAAGLKNTQLSAAGFGIAGYDWLTERNAIHQNINTVLGGSTPFTVVNDALVGLAAGSSSGWGIAVVSGTGCNCWGWDETRTRIGRVTGAGMIMGEGAGASEIIQKAVEHIAHQWTMRGPATKLSDAMMSLTHTQTIEELLEGLLRGHFELDASAAPLVFEIANQGDAVAQGIIQWAGHELAEMVNAVIRQLNFADQDFEVIKVGSLLNYFPQLSTVMENEIHTTAPYARILPLFTPPAVGGIILAMEKHQGEISIQSRREMLSAMQVQLNKDPSN
jgi:N-acetylglucosamine kinase-like BadF-type ATPase